ncbi:Rieske (2Fe-2S) protein [Blastococcus sp. MG754426]|uniref:QcrA and Rieske domain-containing protein n=1 Tax=unclassified Blastococcus TaxID=2619396 RepID=UPI001EF08A80|nr:MULTISPECIES: Rieske (2Fe-2S) protein [unclassified Blastococcus]MCF6506065.1 Rieske (2Fe-2S) protein [Blastococcus sp. MG754426]MCF6510549.1 Rieske (2Fe-2S) protein [Blastococcus sp. MG754427]
MTGVRPGAAGDRLRRPVPVGVGAVAAALLVAFVAGVFLDWPTSALGLALTGALLAVAVVVGQVRGPVARELVWPDERCPGDAPVATAAAAAVATPVRRRWVLGGLGGLGVGALTGVGLLAWSGRDGGPVTAWRRGVHLVTAEGQRIRAADVPVGGFGTVWPEGSVRADLSAVVLVRLATQEAQPPTVLDWVVGDRIVAYSKICTHAGCPVGLYQEDTDSLFCPCHQATFDAARGAVPTFGPASRPLPQLPLGVDGDGFLVATDGFPTPIGPVRG